MAVIVASVRTVKSPSMWARLKITGSGQGDGAAHGEWSKFPGGLYLGADSGVWWMRLITDETRKPSRNTLVVFFALRRGDPSDDNLVMAFDDVAWNFLSLYTHTTVRGKGAWGGVAPAANGAELVWVAGTGPTPPPPRPPGPPKEYSTDGIVKAPRRCWDLICPDR
jgi:hypothetical protein